jgi:flagellar biosynthesis/type III secretory pathway protein FliH
MEMSEKARKEAERIVLRAKIDTKNSVVGEGICLFKSFLVGGIAEALAQAEREGYERGRNSPIRFAKYLEDAIAQASREGYQKGFKEGVDSALKYDSFKEGYQKAIEDAAKVADKHGYNHEYDNSECCGSEIANEIKKLSKPKE